MEQNINANNTAAESAELSVLPVTAESLIAGISGNTPSFYCSFKPQSDADKAALYNAMNNPDVQIGDHIGQIINMRDVIVEAVDMEDDKGNPVKAPRCTIIDMDGATYCAISTGIYNALSRIIGVFGAPTWTSGLPVKVRQINTKGGRRVYTLDAII